MNLINANKVQLIQDINVESFFKDIKQSIKELQGQGFILDIQYSTTEIGGILHYSALILPTKALV